jgi:DNA repair photolyase
MGLYAGLRPEDSRHWGQFTSFKANAPQLLERCNLRDSIIYCSPLVDPYQPVEREYKLMPRLLSVLLDHPPRAFTIQTRAPLILRDMALLKELSARTHLRVSMSVTTNLDSVRKRYEPHCEPNEERLEAITSLREHGIEVYATLAPLLPCDPETLALLALKASQRRLVGDPLHIRQTKRYGATTRTAARSLAEHCGEQAWFDAAFQAEITRRIEEVAAAHGFAFDVGPRGFSVLAGALPL